MYVRVSAVIRHARVSFASNQDNGLSDKEGGTLTQQEVSKRRDCVVTLCICTICAQNINDGCSYHE